MDGQQKDPLEDAADSFSNKLTAIKEKSADFNWYPYHSMFNMPRLKQIVPPVVLDNLTKSKSWKVLDIGPADGDIGFFLESLGCSVDFLDNPPTNFNDCHGIAKLAEELGSNSQIITQDIDTSAFVLEGQYDFAVALGLLYHLRNPMGFLMTLAGHAERMVLSTRVATHLPDGTCIEGQSIGYLLACRESNNDPTNYWTMSALGLETMLRRCGWSVQGKMLAGSEISNPVDNNADQRMFVYCERSDNWSDLGKHHDF